MFTMGISQDFPRAAKRRLKGERKRFDAQMDQYGLLNDRKVIARDTALSWLDVYEAERALRLAHELAVENGLQVQSMESGYRSGRNAQADLLAAKVETDLANDKEQDWQHHVERMRAALSRWIGSSAGRPLADDLSAASVTAELARVIAAIEQHPAVSEVQAQVEAAETTSRRHNRHTSPTFRSKPMSAIGPPTPIWSASGCPSTCRFSRANVKIPSFVQRD